MDIILGLVIIVILLLILGVGIDVIIFGAAGLMIAGTGLSAVFLLYCLIRLFFSKKSAAEFSHIGKRGKHPYDVAYYTTDEGELPNIFPCEVMMKKKLYRKERRLTVLIDVRKKYVYDPNAVATIILGVVLLSLLFVLLAQGYLMMLGNYP